MRKNLLVLMVCLVASAAHAQLYRCEKGGSIIYSESPCAPNAVRKQLDGQAPSAADAAAARRRAAADKVDGQIIDNRAANDRAIKDVYAAQADAERAAKNRRCSQHLANAAQAERMRDTYLTAPYKNAEEAKRRAANDAHFSECYGSNGR